MRDVGEDCSSSKKSEKILIETNMDMIEYIVIAIVLFAVELIYFRIADKYNIIDKPNERSSHSSIVLRGGGVIFAISMVVWFMWRVVSEGASADFCHDSAVLEQAQTALAVPKVQGYFPFIVGLVMICGISFWDDIHSLPDSVRLVAQFVAMGLMFHAIGMIHWHLWWFVILSLFICVGATNIYNFMDGINGITGGYSLAVLVPLFLVQEFNGSKVQEFIEPSFLIVAIIGVLVFCFFNFRPKGKAKCFAGDVGSIGMAFIVLFCIGRLIMQTWDVTWMVLLIVYGMDGCLTIIHRIMLHERLGEAHRKHAYQLMANELGMSHVVVSTFYMLLQLVISLVMIYIVPNTILAHWCYMIGVMLLLSITYVLFMKKYYHLHEKYLRRLKCEG